MRAGFSTCVGLAMAIVSAVAAADPGPSKPADSEHLESVAMRGQKKKATSDDRQPLALSN